MVLLGSSWILVKVVGKVAVLHRKLQFSASKVELKLRACRQIILETEKKIFASNVGCILRCPGRLQSVTKQYKEYFLTPAAARLAPNAFSHYSGHGNWYRGRDNPSASLTTWWTEDWGGSSGELGAFNGISLLKTGPGHPGLLWAEWWHSPGPDVRTGLSLSLSPPKTMLGTRT